MEAQDVPKAIGKAPEVQVEVQSGRVELVPQYNLEEGPEAK